MRSPNPFFIAVLSLIPPSEIIEIHLTYASIRVYVLDTDLRVNEFEDLFSRWVSGSEPSGFRTQAGALWIHF